MGLRIVLSVSKSGDGVPRDDVESTNELQLELHDQWISYGKHDVHSSVIDFEKRYFREIDHVESTVSEDSLFATVAFRHSELRNRGHIGSVLMAGGAGTRDLSTTMNEHHLGIIGGSQSPAPQSTSPRSHGWLQRFLFRRPRKASANPDIITSVDSEWLTFTTAAGVPLAHYSASGSRCTAALIRRFTQFLRYFHPVHPAVLDRIEEGRYLPNRIQISSLEGFKPPQNSVNLEVRTVVQVQDSPPSVEGYQTVIGSKPLQPIDAAIERVLAQPTAPQSDVVTRRTDAFRMLWSEGKPLEAALSYLELIIETGAAPQELSQAVRTSSDDQVKLLMKSMQPTNAEEGREAVRALLGLRAAVSRGQHVLMVLEAGIRMNLGEVKDAIELLNAAIAINPYLTGAYKDLGDLYSRQYLFERAWRCWTVARHISPSHPMLEKVCKLEERLLAQHPKHF